jgi:hypothetical protein
MADEKVVELVLQRGNVAVMRRLRDKVAQLHLLLHELFRLAGLETQMRGAIHRRANHDQAGQTLQGQPIRQPAAERPDAATAHSSRDSRT